MNSHERVSLAGNKLVEGGAHPVKRCINGASTDSTDSVHCPSICPKSFPALSLSRSISLAVIPQCIHPCAHTNTQSSLHAHTYEPNRTYTHTISHT